MRSLRFPQASPPGNVPRSYYFKSRYMRHISHGRSAVRSPESSSTLKVSDFRNEMHSCTPLASLAAACCCFASVTAEARCAVPFKCHVRQSETGDYGGGVCDPSVTACRSRTTQSHSA